MATDIERLQVTLEASVTKFERALSKANGEATKRLGAIEKRFEESNGRIARLMNSTSQIVSSGLGRLGALAGAVLSTDAIRKYADEWQTAVNKISAANMSRQGAGDRASQLTDIAIRSNADLGATADLYSGLTRATRDLGASQAQVLKVTETVNKAFAVGGQSTSTQAGAIMQLNQALQSGKLSGEEFNSVAEGAPLIMDLVAKKLNVTRGELKALASDGKITSKVFFEALLEGGAAVEAQFATMVPTIEQSLNRLQAALARYFGQLATEYDISAKFAAATQAVLNNLDTVVKAAAVVGVAIAAAFAGGPILGGIAAAGVALAAFGDQIRPIAGDIATIGDYARVAFDYVMAAGGEAATALTSALQPAIDTIVGLLSNDLPASAATFLSAVTGALDAVINAFQFASDAITIAWQSAGSAIAESMINAMNTVIAAVNRAVAAVIANINAVLSYAGQAAIAAPNIAEFKNAYAGAGAAAGAAMGDAFTKRFNQRTVGDAVSGVGKAIDDRIQAVRESANARGDARAEAERERRRQLSPRDDGSLSAKLRNPAGADEGGGGGGAKGKKSAAEKQSEYDRELENLNKRILALGREKEALGLSAFEAAKAEAAHKLLDAAKKDGTPITEELTRKIDEQSAAYARAKVALDEAKASHQAYKDLQQFIGTSLSGFFSDIVSGGKNASEALMNLTKKLADAALQAMLLGQGPLAGLFGMKGSGGNVGGIVGALFGGFKMGGAAGTTGTLLYSGGGYTGGGGKYEPAGVVHRGEYVLPAEVVKRLGLDNLRALHKSGLRGYAMGGLVGAPSLPALPSRNARGGMTFAPVTTIDARGSQMGETQFRAILDENNKRLLHAVPTYLEMRGRRS